MLCNKNGSFNGYKENYVKRLRGQRNDAQIQMSVVNLVRGNRNESRRNEDDKVDTRR